MTYIKVFNEVEEICEDCGDGILNITGVFDTKNKFTDCKTCKGTGKVIVTVESKVDIKDLARYIETQYIEQFIEPENKVSVGTQPNGSVIVNIGV